MSTAKKAADGAFRLMSISPSAGGKADAEK
jgi:hypothetical protein